VSARESGAACGGAKRGDAQRRDAHCFRQAGRPASGRGERELGAVCDSACDARHHTSLRKRRHSLPRPPHVCAGGRARASRSAARARPGERRRPPARGSAQACVGLRQHAREALARAPSKEIGLRRCATLSRNAKSCLRSVQVAPCVFAFRGTRLTKAGTVAADLELLKDRDAELYYSARALRHVRRHVRRLQAAAPGVQWAFFTTGAPAGRGAPRPARRCVPPAGAGPTACGSCRHPRMGARGRADQGGRRVGGRAPRPARRPNRAGPCGRALVSARAPGRAGHSLGGFTAVSCAVLCDRLHSAVAFEAPGLTTFYHRAAACRGGAGYWRERVTTYLAIPNPINMCQSHLGRIVRCAPAPRPPPEPSHPRLMNADCRIHAHRAVLLLRGNPALLVDFC